jgi:hypothetical protein
MRKSFLQRAWLAKITAAAWQGTQEFPVEPARGAILLLELSIRFH